MNRSSLLRMWFFRSMTWSCCSAITLTVSGELEEADQEDLEELEEEDDVDEDAETFELLEFMVEAQGTAFTFPSIRSLCWCMIDGQAELLNDEELDQLSPSSKRNWRNGNGRTDWSALATA